MRASFKRWGMAAIELVVTVSCNKDTDCIRTVREIERMVDEARYAVGMVAVGGYAATTGTWRVRP